MAVSIFQYSPQRICDQYGISEFPSRVEKDKSKTKTNGCGDVYFLVERWIPEMQSQTIIQMRENIRTTEHHVYTRQLTSILSFNLHKTLQRMLL